MMKIIFLVIEIANALNNVNKTGEKYAIKPRITLLPEVKKSPYTNIIW